MKKLLLTAFEPFGGEGMNPSLEAARQMERVEFPGALVRVAELPVDRYRAVDIALDLIRASRPNIVIMLGEAGARYRINPERVAINIDDFRIPDNAGNQPRDEPIIEGGPVGYFPRFRFARSPNESWRRIFRRRSQTVRARTCATGSSTALCTRSTLSGCR